MEKYQDIIFEKGLLDEDHINDFSSSYFEGKKAECGYLRNHRSDKKQVIWDITTGVSGIPTALTIQKGNL